jgi:hypothetical protein
MSSLCVKGLIGKRRRWRRKDNNDDGDDEQRWVEGGEFERL